MSPQLVLRIAVLTRKTTTVLRIRIKVLPVGDHASSEMTNWQSLFLVVAFAALRNGLEVGSQGFVDTVETLNR